MWATFHSHKANKSIASESHETAEKQKKANSVSYFDGISLAVFRRVYHIT